MVDHEAAGALARAGRAGDHHDRRALGIGAGDGIDQVERAGAESDHGDAEAAVVARRRVGREADARLVAQRVVRENPALLDDLEERQHEIARNPEDFAGAVVLEALQQRGRERGHGASLRVRGTNANRPAANRPADVALRKSVSTCGTGRQRVLHLTVLSAFQELTRIAGPHGLSVAVPETLTPMPSGIHGDGSRSA